MTQQITNNLPSTTSAAFDRGLVAATMKRTNGNAMAAFVPDSFNGLIEVAKMMAASGKAVPKHLRNNPGGCMAVAMVAYANGFNPWLLGCDTYEVNDNIAYGAKSISAMVNNSPRLQGRLHYDLSGTWPNRRCLVSGTIVGDDRVKEFEAKAETISVRNSPLWKQQPDQQLMYWATRAWARVYMAEVIMGLVDPDEAVEMQQQEDGSYSIADDAPPRPTRQSVMERPQRSEDDALPYVTTDGVEIELLVEEWVDRFAADMDAATEEQILEGLWDTNSAQITKLREMGRQIDAQALHDAYGLTYDRFHVNGQTKENAEPEPKPKQAAAPKAAKPTSTPQQGDMLSGAPKGWPLTISDGTTEHLTITAWCHAADAEASAAIAAGAADAFWAANADTFDMMQSVAEAEELVLLEAVKAKVVPE